MEGHDRLDHDHPMSTDARHLSVEDRDGVLVVRFIEPKRDLESLDSLREIAQELYGLVRRQPCMLVLNLEAQDINPSDRFFAVLGRLYMKVTKTGGSLKLCNLSPLMVEELRITNLIHIFPPYKSLGDALAHGAPDHGQSGQEQSRPTGAQSPEARGGLLGRMRGFLSRFRAFPSRKR
jgi:hypothetical protein